MTYCCKTLRPLLELLVLLCALAMAAPVASKNPRFSLTHVFGRDGGSTSQLDNPWRMAIDPGNGDIAIADTAKHRVVIFDKEGGFRTSFGVEGKGLGQMQAPCAVAFMPDGSGILVSDTESNRIQLFSRTGKFIRIFASHGNAIGQVVKPTGLAIATSGDIYVSDSGNNRIQVFSPSGIPLRSFGSQGASAGQFELPYDVAIHPDGTRVAVADYGNNRVQILSTNGHFIRGIGEFGTTPGKFWGVSGLAYTRDGTLLVADAANRRVQWFDLAKDASGEFGGGGDAPGQFIQAHAVAADQKSGAVYVSDFYLNRVQAFRDADALPPLPTRPSRILPAFCASAAVLILTAWTLLKRRRKPHTAPAQVQPITPVLPGVKALLSERLVVSPEWPLLACSIAITLLLNHTLWTTAATSSSGTPVLSGAWLAVAALLMISMHFALLLLVPRPLVKPATLILVTLAATIDFFMRRYHIYLDVTMMQNVLGTDRLEAKQQLTKNALVYVALWSASTAIPLLCVRLRADAPSAALKRRARLLAAAIIVALCCLAVLHGRLRTLMDDKPETMLLLNPASALVNLPRAYFSGALPTKDTLIPIGVDARKLNTSSKLPKLLVLVVGESTRGASWGMSGYERDTTPALHRIGVVNFRDVTSCGSNTLTSIPCMFSPWGRRDYDAERIQRSENLLHVLTRAGYEVSWIENSGTCLGVCRGIPSRTLADDHPGGCHVDGCLDGRLVDALRKALIEKQPYDKPSVDRVIALHMAGSHGPSYHTRYPDEFAQFQPECLSDDVRGCDDQAITNSYDNSVLYTDHVLAQIITVLREHKEYASALLFTSDHGESLGENGIYMHGTPYPIAPKVQLHVPMVFWPSPEFIHERSMDMQCIVNQATRPTTHDSVFHSTLNLLEVETSLYDSSVDWTAGCTKTAINQGRSGP